ncbi:MAG: S-layer homology domain-containing protein [Ruminiclostridium sp.]|nr:S-layer homology domain-containing protein [Ruminiclostridium sp.]
MKRAKKANSIKSSVKMTIIWFLVFLALFVGVILIRAAVERNKEWVNPYLDVNENMWSYQYITELNKAKVVPDAEKFDPSALATRGDLILYLYNMDTVPFKEREKVQAAEDAPLPNYADVDEDSEYYDAAVWAYQVGLSSGTDSTHFSPDDLLTREQVCTILIRFADMEGLDLIQVKEPNQFKDSLYIHDYARSGVTACQISGIITGYEDGFFYPEETLTREQCSAVAYRIMIAATTEVPEGAKLVDLTPGAYDALYRNYKDITFEALIPAAETPGPVTFFDRTVFIGDSISMTLESYCNASGALSKAKFLCAGSMSPTNMITGQILPEYPKGSGKKAPIQDSVAATGAEIVYIMLGMDNIAYGIDKSTTDYVTIINNILTRNPDVKIVVQSVTPMTSDSPRANKSLNNETINAFNQRMLEICQENKWHFLNVSEVFKGEDGGLIPDYCSDKKSMGMHFTYDGAKVWVNYLISHIPQDLM